MFALQAACEKAHPYYGMIMEWLRHRQYCKLKETKISGGNNGRKAN